MATLGEKNIADISREELLAAFAAAGNTKAQEELNKTTTTPTQTSTTTRLGDKQIEDITREELINAFAEQGNEEAIRIQQEEAQTQLPAPTPSANTGTNPATASFGSRTSAEDNLSIVNRFADSLEPEDNRSPLLLFNSVLDQVLGLARSQRRVDQQKLLQEAGFTPGAVDAQTMSRILNSLESRNAADFNNLLQFGSQGFAQSVEQEQQIRQTQQQALKAERDAIRELGLSVVNAGGSQELLNAVLSAQSFEAALTSAAGGLQAGETKEDTEIRSTSDGKLVRIDGEGNTTVIYEPDPEAQQSFQLRSVGSNVVEFQTDQSGQVVGQRTVASAPKTSTSVAPTQKQQSSGGLVYTNSDVGAISSTLNSLRGEDGWTNTQAYLDFYNDWTSGGGIPSDFVKLFPPEQYVNPGDNHMLPDFLRNKSDQGGGTSSNPFG